MNEDPILIFIVAAIGGYIFKMWLDDVQSFKDGNPHPKALPGATTCPWSWVGLGASLAVIIVGIETAGEYALGVSGEQSDVYAVAVLGWVTAGFVEEVMFRGFLLNAALKKWSPWKASIILSSIFALLHVQYWIQAPPHESFSDFSRDMGLIMESRILLNPKSLWTLLILFVNSLLFFALRIHPKNKEQSMMPCIAAHVASNLGVFAIKLAQGHVIGMMPPDQ